MLGLVDYILARKTNTRWLSALPVSPLVFFFGTDYYHIPLVCYDAPESFTTAIQQRCNYLPFNHLWPPQ